MAKKRNRSIPVDKKASVSVEDNQFRIPVPVLIAGIMLLGAILRLTNLGYLSLWGDELNHVFSAKNILEQGKAILPSGQPYTYSYIFTYIVSLADRIMGLSEFSNRLPAVVFGLLTILMTYVYGSRLYGDKRVGLIAALFIAILPWYIIRSRIVRMYTLFQFLYIVFAYLFYLGFETASKVEGAVSTGIMGRLKTYLVHERVRPVWLLVSMVVLYTGMKVQGFALQAGPTLLLYALLMAGIRLRHKGWRGIAASKYALVIYASILGLIMFPVLSGFVGLTGIKGLLPGGFEYLSERYATEPFWAFKRYFTDTFVTLHPGIWIAGLGGIVLHCASSKRIRVFTLLLFAVPFLIQSFVFVHPNSVKAHYLFFVFPFFLLMAASALVTAVEWLSGKATFLTTGGTRTQRIMIVVAVAVFAVWPLKSSFDFVSNPRHGDINDRSAERYANWRDACDYVKKRDEGDVIMTSQPWSVYYYLGRVDYYIRMGYNDKLMLREHFRDHPNFAKNSNDPVWPVVDVYTGTKMLRDFNHFKWTVEQNPKGWLIGCHKMFNPAFVDQRVLEYIKKNMKPVYSDRDRSIVVYRWNHRGGIRQPVLQVRPGEDAAYPFELPDLRQVQGKLRLQLDVKNFSAATAGALRVNRRGGIIFNRVDTDDRQVVEAVLDIDTVRPGKNVIEFSVSGGDSVLTVFHVGMTLKQKTRDFSLF